ncbi:disulfide bond formation protein B [Novispirillum sp. DQ9]|uniref:disulfide bond formation protein B n=1 Tax=Novispirillum sp. DQ9 TaxID=3398612 RepID=UPI003C7982E1
MDAFLHPGRPFFAAVLTICAGALAAALIGEHVFGLRPCVLCLTERVPYVLAGAVAAAMAGLPTSPGLRRLGVLLVLLAATANAGISAYHVGVEQHWWASAVCEAPALDTGVDLMQALSTPQRPACDEVSFTLFGISLAGYNFLLSTALAAFAAAALSGNRRRQP